MLNTFNQSMLKALQRMRRGGQYAKGGSLGTGPYINKLLRFKGGGPVQNPPKVYTDPALYNKAANNYNDSLALYNYTQLQKKLEPPGILDKLHIPNRGMNEGKSYNELIERNKKRAENIAPNGTRIGPSPNWSYGNKDPQYQPLYDYANKIILDSKGRISYSNSGGSPDLIHPFIESDKTWIGVASNYDYSNAYPKQPVKYQPQRTVNTTNNTPQTFKQINKNTLQIIPNTPQLPKNNHPITKMQALNPANIGMDNSQISMQGQPINLPKAQLPQQHGKPIYGPGSTIIGYSDEQMNFKPAYQYTGASNNIHNLQDKDLINNPEALRKYVASRDSGYKFKYGGKPKLKPIRFKNYSNNYQ